MFSLFKKAAAPVATINGVAMAMQPRETVLQAALRHGMAFPHSCRVGGCATCKCRLLTGKVKELTSAAYVLTGQELTAGYILACQSVPTQDVAIEVALDTTPVRQFTGRVTGQQQLTHDICRLTVQLDTPLEYKAGQYAQLALESLPACERSYSFATPTRADGVLQFFIKHMAGGQFSSRVHQHPVLNETVTVTGPYGDFWLREADAPLMLIAGGSGLAPVLALLQDAAQQGVQRDATLMFGVRRREDLYALDDIEALARNWRGRFVFVPVLSEQTDWPGVSGLVPQHLATYLPAGAHAYLCGPPAMVDACTASLIEQGVAAAHIHADRFTTITRET
ncbi:2Fe-2S iron-sulfur cluster binding domain-containing protein [Pseudoduganella sp. FT93W]|uniref:2Fe-2S iron-sulfur cluster binding domain-containing protein n=1 Tax=Duganella fentianensis TaxID=2692177 RepID=A0A845HWW9_9BURK|nr:2Fe-2S iron-sulfur cluster binding domain-containing protein [Duganella fentianensis]MYN45894.1 2Fe-2S iron-sulfur cluster binding domain-containing protein [Duganella fentianensis]